MAQQYRVLKGPHHTKTLRVVGVKPEYAERIQGATGIATGRNGESYIQLAFDKSILGLDDDFVFCIPRTCLEAIL